MNPILGLQDKSWDGDRDFGGICQQLKTQQGQGHGHLQLVHGELFSDAVPGPGRENEMRSGLRSPSELDRQLSLSSSPELASQSPCLCGLAIIHFQIVTHWLQASVMVF